MSENYRLMVYDKQTLYKWHSNRLVSANEKTTDEDKKPVGDFHFFNKQWIKKPYLGREGQGVTLGKLEPLTIVQEFFNVKEFNGIQPVIGSWVIGDRACGMGIREDNGITTNNSCFDPHYFE